MLRRDNAVSQPAGSAVVYDRWLPLGLGLVWLGIVAFGLANHELARDEAGPWLLALHSGSLLELLRHIKYEGHASLWYACLFLVSRATASPLAMQVLHAAIAAATVWVVVRYAPFTRLQRVLFAFGYFPLYEYAVVSRDYGLGMLLLFGSCAVLGARRNRFPAAVVLLALIPQTNAFAAIVGLALGLALIADRWLPDGPVLTRDVSRQAFVWGVVAVVVGLGLAALQMAPPADAGIAVGWSPNLSLAMLAKRWRSIAQALFPIPQLERHWWVEPYFWNLWNTRGLQGVVGLALAAILGWTLLGLARRPRGLILLVAAVGGLVAFTYLKFAGEVRHHGHFFLALVMALWIGKIEDARLNRATGSWIGRAWRSVQGPLFTAVLSVHVIAALLAISLDYRYVFSNGKRTAAYLVEHRLGGAPFVADHDYAAQPVLAFMGGKQAYFPRGDRIGSFVIWDSARLSPVTDSTCLDRARRLAAGTGGPAILLLDHPLAVNAGDSAGARELARFVGSTVKDEDFYLYSVAGSPP